MRDLLCWFELISLAFAWMRTSSNKTGKNTQNRNSSHSNNRSNSGSNNRNDTI